MSVVRADLKCACVHHDARECIHKRTHPPQQIDDAFDFPCRDCEDLDEECVCPCHEPDEDDPYGWEAAHG